MGVPSFATDHRRPSGFLPSDGQPFHNPVREGLPTTFCTIPGIADAIRGLCRVLRPSGKLIFFEHGLSPDSRIRRWQERTEPIPHWLFEGCHITRDIPSLLTQGGFQIEEMQTGYLAKFPRSWTYCFWGTATPNRQSPEN